MAYLYRHIRVDKNEPFYIGIGSDDKYARAYDKKARNPHWLNIVKKTIYEVEILLDDLTWEFATKKEIEFISIYKRVKDGGILCNITKGGDGKLGVAPTNAFPKGHIPYMKGRKVPREQVEKLAAINKGRPSWNKGISPKEKSIEKRKASMLVTGYKKSKEHPMFGKTHSDELKNIWKISRKGIEPWNKGKEMTRTFLDKTKIPTAQIHRRIKVGQYSISGDFIRNFDSLGLASKKVKISAGCISLCIKNKRKSAAGYIWKNQAADVNS